MRYGGWAEQKGQAVPLKGVWAANQVGVHMILESVDQQRHAGPTVMGDMWIRGEGGESDGHHGGGRGGQ